MNIISSYETVGDYISQANTTKTPEASNKPNKNNWSGTKNLEESMKLVRGGWDGRPDLGKLSKDIASQTSADIATINTEHQVSGAFVDIGAYLEGVPECMVEFVDQIEPRVVKLGFNMTTSWQMKNKAFSNRGAVVLAICNKLQVAGYAVQITAYVTAKKFNASKHTTSWIVKDSTQPLDEDSLAFWCCHPSAFRRIHFLHSESMSQDIRNEFGYHSSGGYGTCTKLNSHSEAEEALALDVNIDFSTNYFHEAVKEYDRLIAKLNERLAS